MTRVRAREVHLVERPVGWPAPENFRLVEVDLPEPGPGEILVRNSFISVDPYMRGRMSDAPSYAAPYELGQVMHGGAVGEVVAAGPDVELPVGATVLHQLGWRDHALLPAARAQVVDPAAAPSVSAYLGALGMPGLTAYVGLLDVAGLREGDAVFVSGAAGAVGSMVGQIARLRGASRVVGSAGSPAKVARLGELGFDAAFDYHDGPIVDQLAEHAPDGIDVFFDNVGGEHLEAAIGALKLHARIVLSGMVSQYNDEKVVGPRNLWNLSVTRSKMLAFMVTEELDLQPDFIREVGGWAATGKLHFRETVVEGLDNTLDAFLQMMRGENVGKMVVKL